MPRRRVLADLTPLKESRDYRLLFGAYLVSFPGTQFTVVAMQLQVFVLTKSSLAVGLIGAAVLVPRVVLSIVGGSIADAVDRRRLLLVLQVVLGATSAGLALNAEQAHPALWPIYVLAALNAGLGGMDMATRSAATPALVRRTVFPAASALNQIVMQTGFIVGPPVAAYVFKHVSVAAPYWVDVVSYATSFLLLFALRPLRPEGESTRAGLGSIVDGLRFLKGQRLLVSTFLIDINAMAFGMPRALFPALSVGVFHDIGVAGWLYAAPGAGALLGAFTTGWVSAVRRQGRAVIVAVALWGVAIAGFGFARSLPLAVVLLAVAGAADMVSAVFRNTILQMAVPDNLRGRLSGVHIAVVSGGPQLGDVEAGTVAQLVSTQFSVVSGGLACVVGALVLARLIPQLNAYDAGSVETASSYTRPEPS